MESVVAKDRLPPTSPLRAPRAAAVAGILFAVLLIAGIALLRLSVPADPLDTGTWLAARAGWVALALNLVPFAGIAGAMPGGGGTSQTAVNRRAGARTQVAGLTTAAAALATMLLLAPLMALMPQATLAAVVIVYSIGLIQPGEFVAILRVRRMEFLWALAACAGVVLLGTLQGILVAIIVSLVALSYQAAHPRVYTLGRKPGTEVFRPRAQGHPEDETFPGLLMVRPEGRIFFANAPYLGEQLLSLIDEATPRVLAIDFSAVPDIEYSALKMLIEGEERLRERGIRLSTWRASFDGRHGRDGPLRTVPVGGMMARRAPGVPECRVDGADEAEVGP